jgi:hypothetical protein
VSRWDAVSSDDYYDEPWAKQPPCATVGCDGTVEHPIYLHCYRCRCELLEKAAQKPVRVKSHLRKESA